MNPYRDSVLPEDVARELAELRAMRDRLVRARKAARESLFETSLTKQVIGLAVCALLDAIVDP